MAAPNSTQRDTIFALASAPGRSGVAVIRISGPAAGEALQGLTGRTLPAPRRASLRRLMAPGTGAPIDTGLALWLPGPASFTGEDVVEIHCHGGRAVVRSLLEAIGGITGCRPAEAGEFARRAFDNGRLDLAEAEGLADLIDAETEAQRVQALAQSSGALSRVVEAWRSEVVGAMALVEAAIDFSDEEDVSARAVEHARGIVTKLKEDIARTLQDGHRGEILREGFRVVLIGAPNAGKSSLLNALARRDAAIVSAEAGTTRDVIEVRLDLGGYPVIIADTAGLREAEGEVEREGMRRTLAEAGRARLIVWLEPADRSEPLETSVWPGWREEAALPEGVPVLRVMSKADLANAAGGGRAERDGSSLAVSAKSGEGLAELTRAISEAAAACLGAGAGEVGVVTQVRHRHCLEAASLHLDAFLSGDQSVVELRAEDLRLAALALGRITGRIEPEEVLGEIFGRFCIGK